jgi:hypothetical protein
VIGVFLDAFSAYYDRTLFPSLDSRFPWSEAQRSRTLIGEYLKDNGEKMNVAKFKQIKDMRSFFKSRIGRERGTSFDVSNLGVMKIDGEQMQGWEMGKLVFSRSAFVSGSAIAVGVVTGPDGCLTIGFCWQEGVVERYVVEMMAEKVRAGFEMIAS